MLAAGSPASYAYWNPADKAASATLSDSNKVVTASAGTTSWVRSVTSKNAGKWRIQLVNLNQLDTSGVGFATSGPTGSFLGGTAAGWGLFGNYGSILRLYNNNAILASPGVVFATNDVIDLLLDIGAGKAWWRRNGTVVFGNPVAGTTPMATFTPGTSIFVAADPFANAASWRLRTDPAEMTGASVSGFVDGWPV
ncbi:hypothetical protein GCM10027359_08950 [Marilutibacter aestuarii]